MSIPKNTMHLDHGQIEVMDETMAAVFRAKTPAERLRIGFGFWTSAQKMLQTHLATQHPEHVPKVGHRNIGPASGAVSGARLPVDPKEGSGEKRGYGELCRR